jgi:hypothetical protein
MTVGKHSEGLATSVERQAVRPLTERFIAVPDSLPGA